MDGDGDSYDNPCATMWLVDDFLYGGSRGYDGC
jgi:hypothetical protein